MTVFLLSLDFLMTQSPTYFDTDSHISKVAAAAKKNWGAAVSMLVSSVSGPGFESQREQEFLGL